ncbi:hypothetical protein CYMTET_22363 [Cymbomonas tetramitiformis]|uniref:Uncharacterized protein n=1 Tax=Cymbomonas tetramitiformis TaxID=36881 RepID=A0AAE0L276_9CHLO|nr:hypothetical protein CYMTET_22363 [Cymbomonas tetramitiformis]
MRKSPSVSNHFIKDSVGACQSSGNIGLGNRSRQFTQLSPLHRQPTSFHWGDLGVIPYRGIHNYKPPEHGILAKEHSRQAERDTSPLKNDRYIEHSRHQVYSMDQMRGKPILEWQRNEARRNSLTCHHADHVHNMVAQSPAVKTSWHKDVESKQFPRAHANGTLPKTVMYQYPRSYQL